MKSKKKSISVKQSVPIVPIKRKIVKRVGIAAGTLLALWLIYHRQMSKNTINKSKSTPNVPGPSGSTLKNYKKWYDSPYGPGGKYKERKRVATNIIRQTYGTNRIKNILRKGKWKAGNYENLTRRLLGKNNNTKNNNIV